MLQKISFLLLAVVASSIFGNARADEAVRPLALVYQGEGSCEEGCSEAAAAIAELAGFRVKYVGPEALKEDATDVQVKAVFENAKVWIQPGGVAMDAMYSMTYKLRTELVNFIDNGGGYVGFCAGAYMATSRIGKTRWAGLGIFPGVSAPYGTTLERYDVDYSLEPLTWNGVARTVYYEGGPYLYGFNYPGSGAEEVAKYDTGATAAARATYGKGRVFISGPHPEAPAVWTEEDGIHDPDGNDWSLAIDMVKWASGR